jgi:hypothetical protein
MEICSITIQLHVSHCILSINFSYVLFSIMKLLKGFPVQKNRFYYILYSLQLFLFVDLFIQVGSFILLQNSICCCFIIEYQNMEWLILWSHINLMTQSIWILVLFFKFVNFEFEFFINLKMRHFHQTFAKSALLYQIWFQKTLI